MRQQKHHLPLNRILSLNGCIFAKHGLSPTLPNDLNFIIIEGTTRHQTKIYKFTNFCEFELRKLSINFLEKDDWRGLFPEETEAIRKLGFKNSWSSYFDLHKNIKLHKWPQRRPQLKPCNMVPLMHGSNCHTCWSPLKLTIEVMVKKTNHEQNIIVWWLVKSKYPDD